MATRFDIKSGTGGLRSGYDRSLTPADGQVVPSCGIEDVDIAMFTLFDREIKFIVSNDGGDTKKVPVIFASGEKWALLKKNKALRDSAGTLILPLITITRSQVAQDTSSDITGRGINQQTGELVVKRRLDSTDRGYQNIINKLGIKNQSNVAQDTRAVLSDQLATDRKIDEFANDPDVNAGALLKPDLRNNVYEVITIPSPQFYNVGYDVSFWTQYTTHMNQLLEKLMSSYLPQGKSLKLDTPKGYWFIGRVENGSFAPETNFDDMSSDERLIRCKFSINVRAYIVASQAPGVPAAVKRYVSAPTISFDLTPLESVPSDNFDSYYLGSDDPTLPLDDKATTRADRRNVNASNRLVPESNVQASDPALERRPRGVELPTYKNITYVDPVSGRTVTRRIRTQVINRANGESIVSQVDDLGAFGIKIID